MNVIVHLVRIWLNVILNIEVFTTKIDPNKIMNDASNHYNPKEVDQDVSENVFKDVNEDVSKNSNVNIKEDVNEEVR